MTDLGFHLGLLLIVAIASLCVLIGIACLLHEAIVQSRYQSQMLWHIHNVLAEEWEGDDPDDGEPIPEDAPQVVPLRRAA
jgi:hypothetical protein